MIYLASPYSHNDVNTRQLRYIQTLKATAHLFTQGLDVFSPIVYTHPICSMTGLSMEFKRWEDFDMFILRLCSQMIILTLPGWEESNGLAEEIKDCYYKHIPIRYMNPDTYEITEQP